MKTKVSPKRPTENEAADLLHGMQAIADYLGVKRSQAYYMASRDGMPTFTVAGRICARRVTLNRWLAQIEAKAMEARNG